MRTLDGVGSQGLLLSRALQQSNVSAYIQELVTCLLYGQ